jgi:Copper transport outer membrane protein, MctB
MGYSARYHAVSIAAIFLALAVGLLLGAEFGDDVLRDTAQSLESSLKSDLEDARGRIDELEGDLGREQRFGEEVYPALVGDTLPGRSLAVVALGGRPDALRDDFLGALEPTGAEVTQIAVVRQPPDVKGLADLVAGRRHERERAQEAARRAGTTLVDGRPFYEDAQDVLLSGFSGSTDPVNGVIVVRQQPASAEDDADTEAIESSLVDGLVVSGVPVVGVERTDADPSSIGFFQGQGLTTVDDIDLTAGGVSLVYALRGAKGAFGVGEGAELVPPLLRRPGEIAAP